MKCKVRGNSSSSSRLCLAPHKVGLFFRNRDILNGICSNEVKSTRKSQFFLSAILRTGLILDKNSETVVSCQTELPGQCPFGEYFSSQSRVLGQCPLILTKRK